MDIPRPEHPRPDLMRDLWLNLNGVWDFTFDDYEIGDHHGYYYEDASYKMKINVPFVFESPLSGIDDQTAHPCIWYKRNFKISSKLRDGKRIFINFGAVDYKAIVWLNGVKLGEHKGGYSSFSFEITNLLKEKNCVVVKVIDRTGDQPRGKQYHGAHPRGCRYTRVTGIWQTVWIEARGKTYIKNYKVYPTDHDKVMVKVSVRGPTEGIRLRAEAFYAGWDAGTVDVDVKNHEIVFELPLRIVRLWWPEDPNLYRFKISLFKEDELIDEIHGLFGLRRIVAKNGWFKINGKKYYLKMVLDQGYWPNGLYTAPSDNDIRRDVEAVKELGFNGVRAHQKPRDPRYLYWCDKIGVLVWEESADWGMPLTSEWIEPFWSEWRSIIERDFNHPCIIAWTCFNERSNRESPYASRFIKTIYERTKDTDPTRPVLDNSGWFHVATDIADVHAYVNILKLPEKWRAFIDGDWKAILHEPWFEDYGELRDQPRIISEIGGWGIKKYLKPLMERPPFYYDTPVEDEFEFISRYRELIRVLKQLNDVAGFCYTQLYDIEGEVNGFLTYDRRWKIKPEIIASINSSLTIS